MSDFEARRQAHIADALALLPGLVAALDWPAERIAADRDARLRALVVTARERSPWHRARLAHVILMGRDAEAMRAAADQRISELEAEVAAAGAKAEALQQDWNALQDLLGRRS